MSWNGSLLRQSGRTPTASSKAKESDVASPKRLAAIHQYGRIRRRDGAFRWGIYRDLEDADRYVETFLISSWAEHLRQHERATAADREAEERLGPYVTGVPNVRHLVWAEPDRSV